MATLSLNAPVEIEGDDDDFEVVSPPPELNDSLFSTPNTLTENDLEDAKSGHASEPPAAAEGSTDNDADSSNAAIDPLAAFELIRREHSLAKAALMEQQSLLSNSFAVLRSQNDSKQKEIDELRAQIADLELKAETVASERDHLKKEVESMLAYRDQVDELTAKICEQEDVIAYQERMIKQCKIDGYVNVQPQMLTDHFIAKDLRDKDEVIKKLHDSLDSLEEKYAREKERADSAEAILKVMTEENQECQQTMAEMHNMYQEEVNALRRQLSSDATIQPVDTLSRSRDHEDAAELFTCKNCHLHVMDRSLYDQHVANCNPALVTSDEVD